MHGSEEPTAPHSAASSPTVEVNTELSPVDHIRLSDAYHVLAATIRETATRIDTYALEDSQRLHEWGRDLEAHAESLAFRAEFLMVDSPHRETAIELGLEIDR